MPYSTHFATGLTLDVHRGRVLRELRLRRTDLIITTKLFWGLRDGPNDGGLSRKQYAHFCASPSRMLSDLKTSSIIEGTRESLDRLQLDYVDVIFAHRPDPTGELLSCGSFLQRPTERMCSTYARDCSCIYLGNRKGLGALRITNNYPLHILNVTLCSQAFYWATSEWSARDIEEAFREFNVTSSFD